MSQHHGTTLFMTLLAAWAALLARLSGQGEVVIGTPVANRSDVAVEGLIGFFVNTLAVRVDVSGPLTVAELLARVKAQVLAAQTHQDLPFEQVVAITESPRTPAYHPVFQVMFAWEQAEADESLGLAGLEITALRWTAPRLAKFDLMLALQPQQGRIVGGVEYAASIFDHGTVERWLGHFKTLLEGIAADDTENN